MDSKFSCGDFTRFFFYRFCCQNFQWLSRHHYTHRKQQYGCGERSELHCASHSYSQQKYTLGLPDRKIFINICYSIYTVKSRAEAPRPLVGNTRVSVELVSKELNREILLLFYAPLVSVPGAQSRKTTRSPPKLVSN